jgi:hypothetical protein
MTDRPSAVLGPVSWLMAIAHAYPIAKPGRMTVFDTKSFKELTQFETGIYPSGVEFPTRTVFRRSR